MKSFVRIALLVSVAWSFSVHAGQPAAVNAKGPVSVSPIVKESSLLDLERWFRDKLRQLGTTILPSSLAPDEPCNPLLDPTGCTGIERTKCPIG